MSNGPRRTSSSEHSRPYRSFPGRSARSFTLSRVLMPVSAAIFFIWFGSVAAKDARKDVDAFVRGTYFHGMSYEEANAFGPQAIPALERMLRDDAMKPYWTNILTTIAYIGSPRSFRILRWFMWERFNGTVDNRTWRALLTVPNVMGTIPDYPGASVSQYLESGTNPAFWDSLPWTEAVHARNGDLGITLSEVSINGLSCKGTPRTAEILTKLQRNPHSQRQLANISEGLTTNAEVSRKGLQRYLKEARERMGASRVTRGKK